MTKHNAWGRYRTGKACLWGGFLLFVPAVVLVTYALKAVGVSGNPTPWVAFAWMAVWLVNGMWLARFLCPKCNRRFFIYSPVGIGNLWATKCCHCGARPDLGIV